MISSRVSWRVAGRQLEVQCGLLGSVVVTQKHILNTHTHPHAYAHSVKQRTVTLSKAKSSLCVENKATHFTDGPH